MPPVWGKKSDYVLCGHTPHITANLARGLWHNWGCYSIQDIPITIVGKILLYQPAPERLHGSFNSGGDF